MFRGYFRGWNEDADICDFTNGWFRTGDIAQPAGQCRHGTTVSSVLEDADQPTPIVPWFDSIFADICDAQSLTQSLSTFGGAIKRWAGILDALDGMASSTSSTEASESVPALVLLDEIGMGTDPNEGASLAVSLLERLAATGGARLSVCTTHHAACARLASERDDFVPAAMRYDANTLQPTYELIWNAIGESRALDVAKRCGMPRAAWSTRNPCGGEIARANTCALVQSHRSECSPTIR